MTAHLLYYLSFIISVIVYFNIKSYYRPLEKRNRKIIYTRRLLIVSLYIISAWGILLITELEGGSFFNWFFLISSVIILFISVYLIKKLEFLRN